VSHSIMSLFYTNIQGIEREKYSFGGFDCYSPSSVVTRNGRRDGDTRDRK
jgi:hypothetical protein